jgi:uncharacterized protein YjeT (DUF2065 family)
MRRGLTLLLGLGLFVNGLWMLVLPQNWYGLVPGVISTGPANLHFIRDIGCAYLTVGGSLLWMFKSLRAWPAVFAGGIFLTLHAMVHVWDTIAGLEYLHQMMKDIPAVVLPGVLVLWLSWDTKRELTEE